MTVTETCLIYPASHRGWMICPNALVGKLGLKELHRRVRGSEFSISHAQIRVTDLDWSPLRIHEDILSEVDVAHQTTFS